MSSLPSTLESFHFFLLCPERHTHCIEILPIVVVPHLVPVVCDAVSVLSMHETFNFLTSLVSLSCPMAKTDSKAS